MLLPQFLPREGHAELHQLLSARERQVTWFVGSGRIEKQT